MRRSPLLVGDEEGAGVEAEGAAGDEVVEEDEVEELPRFLCEKKGCLSVLFPTFTKAAVKKAFRNGTRSETNSSTCLSLEQCLF